MGNKLGADWRRVGGAVAVLALVLNGAAQAEARKVEGRWMAGDFHTHTYLTDGSHTQADVLAHAFGGTYDAAAGPAQVPGFGLDWMANSEHGGARNRNPDGLPWPPATEVLGNPPAGTLWRWQSLWQYSYPIVAATREAYEDKLVVQGYEWNVPSHEHASVGIVGRSEDGGRAIAQHEYLFDAADTGTLSDANLGVTGKVTVNDHAKAVAGAAWLQANYPGTSYFLPNHPSRQLKYSAADLRDFNDAAPRVCFGFEGLPGHQKEPSRGGYSNNFYLSDRKTLDAERTARARTYGGADFMVAKVGGLWDSLLGEGRHFWAFVNSDFHSAATDADFYPGEYAKTYTFVKDEDRDGRTSYEELVDGLRSGNSFAVQGDLIEALEFSAKSHSLKAGMGETLSAQKGDSVMITIRFRSPSFNNNGDAPRVDHIDLIAGDVAPRALPGTVDYQKDTNDTARVVAKFDEGDWEEDDGWIVVKHKIKHLDRPMYFRLRGTNLRPATPSETDAEGSPLNDDLAGPNDAQKAYTDLWFYSNPIFVDVR